MDPKWCGLSPDEKHEAEPSDEKHQSICIWCRADVSKRPTSKQWSSIPQPVK